MKYIFLILSIISLSSCASTRISGSTLKVDMDVLAKLPDKQLVAYFKLFVSCDQVKNSKRATEAEKEAAEVKIEEVTANIFNSISKTKPAQRTEPRCVVALSDIMSALEGSAQELEVIRAIIKLHTKNAAMILRSYVNKQCAEIAQASKK